jgi:uncharacterized protein YbjT (DUF2867 family)
MSTIVVVGATGSVGRHVVEQALRRGHATRALVRDRSRGQAGDPSDGVIARRQIAEVLVGSIGSDDARRKTFELVATTGAAPDELDPLFAALQADPAGAVDGARDTPNMPLDDEPGHVREDLATVAALATTKDSTP